MLQDDSLHQAYMSARYVIYQSSREKVFKVGEQLVLLQELLMANKADNAVFITAHNPASQLLKESENFNRNKTLKARLDDAKYTYIEGYSCDEAGEWPKEMSFFVLNMNEADAIKIASDFGQNGFLWIDSSGQVSLKYVKKNF